MNPDGSWLSLMVDDFFTEGDELGGVLQSNLKDGTLTVTFLPYDDSPHTTEKYRLTRID